MVSIKNLSKTYKMGKDNDVHALRDVSFSIADSEAIALVGSSGSGKSTFLNILGGLDSDYEGEIIVGDKNIKEYNSDIYRRNVVGTIFQQFYLIPKLTVEENILLPIYFGKQLSKNEIEGRIDYLLRKVGLTDRRKHKPSELSGGQAQRVAIARALVAKPQLLLADEPTGNLDSKTGLEIIDLLKELNKEEGTTLIVVTHDVDVAKSIGKKIMLRDGKIV
ncbi:MAG TPA: ABC transporter ATP-binding protein [Candidatus Dojkabacteria bacterium]|nr:ABC transporter ATP-binding protein [Candidatus Dojkabacteria bacterium]HQF36387.1 ABC transporter ATP-binding protein [Candidatus Dojkabacteria bacterium]